MSHEPANAHKYAALSLDQIIGLFLVKLYGWLVRCHECGARFAPSDMAQNVTKADALVHAFIRSRAAAQLECAGFIDAANAMRVPIYSREPEAHIKRAQGCGTEQSSRRYERSEGAADPTSVGAPASTQIEPTKSCEPVTPSALLARVESIISTFERADAIGSAIARMVVYTLALLTPETRETWKYARHIASRAGGNRKAGLSSPARTSVGQGPPHPWPPPADTVIPCAMRHPMTLCRHGTYKIRASCLTCSRTSRASLHAAQHPG